MAVAPASSAAASASARADQQPPSSSSPGAVAATRVALAVTLVTIVAWALGPLGGVSWSPQRDPATRRVVSTSKLFNWHPLLMSVALLGFCGEALLAYRSGAPMPLAPALGLLARRREPAAGAGDGRGGGGGHLVLGRPARKAAHAALHAAGLALAALGIVAAWRSHSLADPPIPQLYSPHSWLGVGVAIMFCGQAAAGAFAYLGRLSAPERAAFSPLHRRFGLCAWFAALAAMATGVQEKATLAQAFGKADVRGGVVRTAAGVEIGLLLCALAMAAVFLSPPAASSLSPAEGGGARGVGGGGGGGARGYGGVEPDDQGNEEGLLMG